MASDSKSRSVFFAISFTVVILSRNVLTAAPAETQKPIEDSREMFLEKVIDRCNETFRIQSEYITSLNESGSFPDETDQTPMCFIRCYLEGMSVMNDKGDIDIKEAMENFKDERTVEMDEYQEIVKSCAKNRRETTTCQKAYYFLRCMIEGDHERFKE